MRWVDVTAEVFVVCLLYVLILYRGNFSSIKVIKTRCCFWGAGKILVRVIMNCVQSAPGGTLCSWQTGGEIPADPISFTWHGDSRGSQDPLGEDSIKRSSELRVVNSHFPHALFSFSQPDGSNVSRYTSRSSFWINKKRSASGKWICLELDEAENGPTVIQTCWLVQRVHLKGTVPSWWQCWTWFLLHETQIFTVPLCWCVKELRPDEMQPGCDDSDISNVPRGVVSSGAGFKAQRLH